MTGLSSIREAIREATGGSPDGPAEPAGGGCINNACRLGDYFVKTNLREREDLFAAEQDALQALGEAGAIRVPAVVCSGTTPEVAFLVLEFLPLRPSTPASEETLGRQLAAMHAVSAPEFGWRRDNYIGRTPQRNPRSPSWPEFFRDHRLAPLLQQLAANGTRLRRADQLLEQVADFFPGEAPKPALLHGDLWGGNAGALADGTPVIFDPATYFGDRETDLAMTRLFGGFGPSFYQAYAEAWPLDPGAGPRIELYNVYHILNHALLFGSGYARQAEGMISRLLARV